MLRIPFLVINNPLPEIGPVLSSVLHFIKEGDILHETKLQLFVIVCIGMAAIVAMVQPRNLIFAHLLLVKPKTSVTNRPFLHARSRYTTFGRKNAI